MGAVSRHELVIERGEGVWVYDADGPRYLDATASLWYANIGHGRAEVADAVARRCARSRPTHTFGDIANRPANELCAALAERAPMPRRAHLPDQRRRRRIDTAAKLARRHFVTARPARADAPDLAARRATTARTASAPRSAGSRPTSTNWGPLVPQVSTVPFDSLPALEAEIRERRARPRGGLLLRARDRRRRRAPAARGLHPGRRRPVRRARHPVRHRRRDLRLRPARHVVRDRALGGRHARHDHLRQGRHLAATCRSAGSSSPSASPRRSSTSPAGRCCATARPTPATRRAARPRWPCSTSTSART